MTDAKRATAIISQSLDKKPRRLTAEKAEQVAIRAARDMMPGPDTESGKTFTLDMDADPGVTETLRRMMEETDIPYQETPSLDGARSRFSVDERRTPALKAMLDAYMQTRDDLDQSDFPEWETLRRIARETIQNDPDLKRKNRPVEPDWAATIAGRLNAGLLDRTNGVVHDDWVGGILPPIRSRKHDAALDMVRQNERLIETKAGMLEQEARQSNQPWVRRVLNSWNGDGHLLRDVAVYRAMWGVADPDSPLGERPPAESGRQEQHWANLNGRINHTSTTVKPSTRPVRTRQNQPIQEERHVEQQTVQTIQQERTAIWQPSPAPSKPSRNGLSQ